MTIYEWLEDFDNADLPDHERNEQFAEAVERFNEKNKTHYIPDSIVERYKRIQKYKQWEQ